MRSYVTSLLQICIAFFIVYFSLGQKEPQPAFALEEYQVFADIKEDVPGLKLIWNGKPINNFYSTIEVAGRVLGPALRKIKSWPEHAA